MPNADTQRFVHVQLEESFSGGLIEVVADLTSEYKTRSSFGHFRSIAGYAKPQFGRIVLGMTPGGNPFLSDPCWHSYRYSIHQRVEAGCRIPAGKYLSSTDARPAITPDSHPSLFGAVASAFGITVD
jgi:hypothetical protein